MSKYEVTASLSISTTIEPDGYLRLDEERIVEMLDNGYWGDESISFGTTIVFSVETEEGEDGARLIAEDILSDATFTSRDGIEYEIDSWEIDSLGEIEPPMDMERALALIRAYLDYEVQSGRIDAETRAAFDFLLDTLTP